MRRQTKLAVSVVSILIAYYVSISLLGYRATVDEALVLPDIWSLTSSPHLDGRSYLNGIGAQLIVTTLRVVTDVPISKFIVLSPVIGALAVGFFSIVLFKIGERYFEQPFWALFAYVPPFVIFAGFSNRMMETSHKTYTYVLLFLGFYVAHRIQTQSREYRMFPIMVLVLCALTTINFIWGYIFGGILLVIVLSVPEFRRSLSGVISLVIMTTLSVFYLVSPTILKLLSFRFRAAGGSATEGATQAAGTSVSFIWGWGAISVGSISVPIWLVYVSGMTILAILGTTAIILSLTRIVRRSHSELDVLLFVVSSGFISLSLLFVASGDIATFKRVLPVPSAVAVMYLLSTWDWNFSLGWCAPSPRVLRVSILFLLITGSILAVPRSLLDDELGAPYDNYAEESDLERAEWAINYVSGDCTINEPYTFLRKKLRGEGPKSVITDNHASKVYTVGNGHIKCSNAN